MKPLKMTFLIVLLLCLSPVQRSIAQNTAPDSSERCQFDSFGINDAWEHFVDPVDDSDSWTFSTPEEQGMDPTVLDSGWAAFEESEVVISIIVIRHDAIVLERYFNAGHAQYASNVFSTSKSILSSLVGIAIEEGYLDDVDQTVADLLPDYFADIDDLAKGEVTLRHMLTMTPGMPWEEDMDYFLGTFYADDPVQAVWEYPMFAEPGETFRYHTGMTHTMSKILTQVTGMTTCDYAYQVLFDPLDITVEHWSIDPAGVFIGGTHLFLTARELARFGLLFLHDGEWNGEQVVPADWVAESTQHSGLGDFERYGYWWWLAEIGGYDVVAALGMGGQLIFIIDDLDLVVVSTTSTTAMVDTPRLAWDYLRDQVIPSIVD